MITNGSLTIFHKGLDADTRLEKWIRFNYSNVWFFGGKGAGINKGYTDANNFDCRIPYDQNANLDFKNFAIGDIVINDTINYDIASDDELDAFDTYVITTKIDNRNGTRQHIHIGGK